MNTKKNQQQTQLQAGPIAQQLAKVQSNGHQVQVPPNNQQLSGKKRPKKFSGKTLRDWLNVLGVFLIPLVIAAGSIWFSSQQNATSLQLALDQQRETRLTTYMDDIKDLLLNRGLHVSKPADEVRVVARAETLSALRQLDGDRKGIAIRFLSEAGLITRIRNDVIINLISANLSGANLSGAYLRGAELNGANLNGANLNGAYLSDAELIGANLNGANLIFADLRGADLRGAALIGVRLRDADLNGAGLSGAIMPDGTHHP